MSDSDSASQAKTYTHITQSGRQVVVTRDEYERLHPKIGPVGTPPERQETFEERNAQAMTSESYVKAHGKPNPVRNRVVPDVGW